jgi:hypothetical protein
MEQKFTIEELEAQYNALGAELEARKKAEAEERKAKLAAEKDARFKEVIKAYKHADALRDAVVEDYGYFTYETEDNIPNLWDLFFKR